MGLFALLLVVALVLGIVGIVRGEGPATAAAVIVIAIVLLAGRL